jgi:hypothetical protein
MNYFLFFIGIIILLITAADLINTSLSVRGAGFITKRLSKSIWTCCCPLIKDGAQKSVGNWRGRDIGFYFD